jgi:uncharacterized phage protein gp47/JayE
MAAVALVPPCPGYAQATNVKTVEGAQGKKTTLTAQPHRMAEGLSARAMGVVDPDTTRWALSLIGVGPDESIALTYGDESLPVYDVQRPDDGVGPTTVFVSPRAFRLMAETGTVRITVGAVTTSLPQKLRREMRIILRRVT